MGTPEQIREQARGLSHAPVRRHAEPGQEFPGGSPSGPGSTATAAAPTDAVLETLGERISGGEVEDLIAGSRRAARAAAGGQPLSHGAARRMSLDGFLIRIAEREGVTPAGHPPARAGGVPTLRSVAGALGKREFLSC